MLLLSGIFLYNDILGISRSGTITIQCTTVRVVLPLVSSTQCLLLEHQQFGAWWRRLSCTVEPEVTVGYVKGLAGFYGTVKKETH